MIPDYEEQEIELRKKIVKRQDRNAEILFPETDRLLKKKKKWAKKRNDTIRFWSHHTIHTLEKDLDITQYAESLFIEMLKQ